jgi:hypothetical protein
MVRVLLVRHGMTESNLRDARMAVSLAKGEVSRAEAPAVMRAAMARLPPHEQCGDTRLSAHKGGGVEQAELLARYWGPILRGKALAGQLHVHVSAMQRCLQTADPLMRWLLHEGAEAEGESRLRATVRPMICEVPGLCAPADRAFMEEEVFPGLAPSAGVEAERRARAALAARNFTRCGLNRAEVLAAYPW